MTRNEPIPQAVIVLPPCGRGRLADRALAKWLSRGRLAPLRQGEEMFATVLREIGHPLPLEGLAAYRFWGQTGERSGAWIAAADPVHFEARLDHVRVHAFHGKELSRADMRALYDYLQNVLDDDGRFALARLGPFAYLRSSAPIATANVSPDLVDGREPGEFMPSGVHAGAHDRLLSELQMALHDHEVNQRRAANGLRTVNSIWFWGGGMAQARQARPIPPLFADDPLFRGYWLSCSGAVDSWMADIDQALAIAPGGFVAVAPQDVHASPQMLANWLEKLRRIVRRGGIRTLKLLSRDGIGIDIGRMDAFRFWRRVSPLLGQAEPDD